MLASKRAPIREESRVVFSAGMLKRHIWQLTNLSLAWHSTGLSIVKQRCVKSFGCWSFRKQVSCSVKERGER